VKFSKTLTLNISDLLALENEVSLHISFLRKLPVEIFKSFHGLNPTFISELFVPKVLSTLLGLASN